MTVIKVADLPLSWELYNTDALRVQSIGSCASRKSGQAIIYVSYTACIGCVGVRMIFAAAAAAATTTATGVWS